MEKLYMLEVLVNKVVFAQLPVPLKKNVVIQATCPTIGALEIQTDAMGGLENLEAKERSSRKKDVDIDCGRSILFPIDATKLRDALKKEKLEVTVLNKHDAQPVPIGAVNLPWDRNFIDMVDSSISAPSYLTPVCVEDQFQMTKDGADTATISMFIRLSYLGRTVYTNIQKLISKEPADSGAPSGAPGAPGGSPAQFLFKSIDNATIFKCSRYGMGSDSDIRPIGALYGIANKNPQQFAQTFNASSKLKSKSTETLLTLKINRDSQTSMAPSVFRMMGEGNRTALGQSLMYGNDSIMSIRSTGPLKGQKFFDLTELRMDASTFSTIAGALGMHIYQESGSGGEGEDDGDNCVYPFVLDYKALTVEEIEKRLCKHPDCPAAKLFKNFGIGPLAKNITGLGGLYNDVEAPCAYGLSHCNGTIDDYGPLGRFKRPKKAEEPFVPQSNCKCGRKSSSTISTASKGSNTSKNRSKGKTECYSHCPANPMKLKPPLRLKGGGPLGPECDPIPNPITMCQDLMDEFNRVLKDYKDALGPCGQATCPFALSLVGDACQDICNSSDPEYRRKICTLTDPEAVLEEKDEFTGCGVPNCPYKRAAISPAERDYSKYQGMPGCGFTKCPFVKAKLGMEPDEDTHLPPFEDYQKQKTYKYTDALPPIHWDCPDPLPKGDCKNPDCPFVKRDALVKKYFPDPCCPCGSPVCPYVCAPCTFPGCPFHIAEPCPPICPYTQPPPKELKCTASVCPFVRNTEARCENPECPYKIYEDKLAECANWERHQAILAEQEEEEEEEELCKPCGRAKTQRARCSKSKSATVSLSQMQSTNKTSGTTFTSTKERSSDPCILSAAVEKRNPNNVPCKPETCGKGDHVCGVCKSDRSEKTTSETKKSSVKNKDDTTLPSKPMKTPQNDLKLKESVGFAKTSSKNLDVEVVKSPKEGILKLSSTFEPQNKQLEKKTKPKLAPVLKSDQRATNKPTRSYAPKAVVPKKLMMGPTGKPCPISQFCRRTPFRYDKKSFKPCTKIGHRDCVLPKFLVPKCMGWLWNIHEDYCGLRPRRGWKPGAISKMIAFRIDYFNAMRERRPFGNQHSKHDILNVKPSYPTMQINKKGGIVNVTMHPVKEPAEVKRAGDGNPYMDCSPIQFKITKNNREKEAKYCFCGDQLSETDSSELDIEFSPPAAMKNPRLMHKNELIENEAQYNINDVPIPVKEKKGKKGKKGKGKDKKGKGKKGGKKKK